MIMSKAAMARRQTSEAHTHNSSAEKKEKQEGVSQHPASSQRDAHACLQLSHSPWGIAEQAQRRQRESKTRTEQHKTKETMARCRQSVTDEEIFVGLMDGLDMAAVRIRFGVERIDVEAERGADEVLGQGILKGKLVCLDLVEQLLKKLRVDFLVVLFFVVRQEVDDHESLQTSTSRERRVNKHKNSQQKM
jgi:hypothetical protein